MCEIKTINLYKPLKKEAIKEEPKIFSKIVKVKKQKQKKQKEEEEEEEEEENPDIISNELQRLLFVSGTEKIKKRIN